jgi:hypothetical protein
MDDGGLVKENNVGFRNEDGGFGNKDNGGIENEEDNYGNVLNKYLLEQMRLDNAVGDDNDEVSVGAG